MWKHRKIILEEMSLSNPLPFFQAAQTTSDHSLGLAGKWLVNASDHESKINGFALLNSSTATDTSLLLGLTEN